MPWDVSWPSGPSLYCPTDGEAWGRPYHCDDAGSEACPHCGTSAPDPHPDPAALAVTRNTTFTRCPGRSTPACSGGLVIAAIDRRLGDWFCAVGDGQSAPFVASAGLLASRLDGKACLVIGTGAEVLADELIAAGVDTIAEEALPDPVILGRLAVDVGVDGWRARNAHEGLPRPLYLRGVNITLPDGARRTVD